MAFFKLLIAKFWVFGPGNPFPEPSNQLRWKNVEKAPLIKDEGGTVGKGWWIMKKTSGKEKENEKDSYLQHSYNLVYHSYTRTISCKI